MLNQLNVKTMRKIAQIFVAFSEKLNFNKLQGREVAETTNAIWVWILML